MILLSMVAGALVASMLTAFAHPRYQSTVSLQLNPAATSAFLPYGSGSPTSPVEGLAASYVEVLKSRAFAQTVVQNLNLTIPASAVASSISVVLVPNTNILRLTVSWDDPQDAQNLAQHVAEIFISQNVNQQGTGGASGSSQVSDLETSANSIQTQIDSLQQQRDKLAQSVGSGDLSGIANLNSLDQSLSSLETSRANLLVEINREKSGMDTAAILDNATPPATVGAIPLLQAILFGVAAGVALSGGYIVGTSRFDKVVQEPEDVMETSGSPPIVAVGRLPKRKARNNEAMRPFAVSEPESLVAESYRTLRANLRLAELEHPLKVILVTSAGPREGKTVTASNLAVTLAQSGKRVLLLDADIRRPNAHAQFGLVNQEGFSELVLQWPASMKEDHSGFGNGWVQESGVHNLWVMPAGRASGSAGEIVGSEQAADVIREAANRWDVVVVDTPPVGPVADALLLAQQADGVVMVARAGLTRASSLRSTLGALAASGRPILGVVLNDLRPTLLSRYGQYSYYYRYGYSYYGSTRRAPGKPRPADITAVSGGLTRAASVRGEPPVLTRESQDDGQG